MAFVDVVGVELFAPCSSCGASMPVNRPELESRCSQCLARSAVPVTTWQAVLKGLGKEFGSQGRGVLKAGKLEQTGNDVEWRRGPDTVRCRECASLMPRGATGPVLACAECGATRTLEAVPEWLPQGAAAVRGVLADPPEVDPEQTHAIAITCQHCGASLRTRGEARLVPCQYCETSNVLPDEVWRALHPPKQQRRFWLVCELPADPRRSQEQESFFGTGFLFFVAGFGGLLGGVPLTVVSALFLGLVVGDESLNSSSFSPALLYLTCAGIVFLALALFLFRARAIARRLETPDNEVVGKLGPWRAGKKVCVTLHRPPDLSTALGSVELPLHNERYADLGGQGGLVRAWIAGKRKAARAQPTALM